MKFAGRNWEHYEWMDRYAKKIEASVVPLVEGEVENNLNSLQELADSQTLPNGKPAEGIVVRPLTPISSGIGRPLGFKIINRNYGE